MVGFAVILAKHFLDEQLRRGRIKSINARMRRIAQSHTLTGGHASIAGKLGRSQISETKFPN